MVNFSNSKPLYDDNHELIGFMYNHGGVVHYLSNNSLHLNIHTYLQILNDCKEEHGMLNYINKTYHSNFDQIELIGEKKFIEKITRYKRFDNEESVIYYCRERMNKADIVLFYEKKTKILAYDITELWHIVETFETFGGVLYSDLFAFLFNKYTGLEVVNTRQFGTSFSGTTY